MKFHEIADCFEQIEQVSGRLAKTELLADLLKKATTKEASIISYLSLGVLHPPHVGTQFGIASKSAIPILADLLDKSESAVASQVAKLGDEGSVVATGDWEGEERTVTQVYDVLQKLERLEGTGSQEKRAEMLVELLSSVDPISAKYVLRMVLGKLRLGFSDMTVIDALSWMEVGDKSLRDTIEHAYNICADIGRITAQLKEDGIEALEEMEIQVGTPIRPAAAERLPTARAIVEKLGDCVAQPKLDGFRLQIHIDRTKSKPAIRFFSRNLQDMSEMFPDVVGVLGALSVDTMICEGEAIAYDPNTGNFLPFQQTVKRKRKHGIESAAEDLPLKIFLFDLLYLDGKSYLEKSHDARRKALLKVAKGVDTQLVQVIDEKKITTPEELEAYFLQNIDAGLEGLVVKRPDAIYRPGKRNFNWIKLKRQEEGHLEDTLDCVILGYYNGKGKRAQFGIGAFLVGVYNKKEDCFQTVAKVGTGLTDAGWKELKVRCDEVAVSSKPSNVECAKELTPDAWVAPEIVCMIRADEITISQMHSTCPAGGDCYALRFPRFMGYRDDKGPGEATTSKEVGRLFEDQKSR